MTVLVAYASKHGSTQGIAERIAERLRQLGKEAEARPLDEVSDPGSYKSNNLMKRQAVQFRVFAYGDNHVGLGELSADVMDALSITAVWSAKVANRKISR